MTKVDSAAVAMQIFEADLKCKQHDCKNCFIFPLIRKTGDCEEAVRAAERFILEQYKNRQNRQP